MLRFFEYPGLFIVDLPADIFMNLEELHVYWQSIIDSLEALENEGLESAGMSDEDAWKSANSYDSLMHRFNAVRH